MAAPWLLALGMVLGLLVLIPARRLQLAGVASRTIGLFSLSLWLLAMLVAIRPTATRILIPILLIAYIAPFVTAPERLRRVLDRGGAPRGGAPRGGGATGRATGRPPMKNVTPADPPEPRDDGTR